MHGNKQYILMIMDGVGLNDESKGNAFKLANTPNLDKLIAKYPNTYIATSGMAVGLPEGQMGNSEVGHTNIGAGRIVYQDLTRITKEINDGDFFKNEEFLKAIENVKNNNSSLHLMGLLSDGGVHSHNSHLYALLKLAKEQGIENVYIHAFLDGRDTPPTSAIEYLKELEEKIKEIGVGKIATLVGRYYAMDRDENWDRTKAYYDLVVGGKGLSSINIEKSINSSYEKGITDEFIKPIICSKNTIKNGDIIMWMNYRADRAKQILSSIVNWSTFDGFSTENMKDTLVFSFLPVDKKIKTYNLIEPVVVKNSLGLYLSELDFTQARIAESEKFPHVTYFFDGGVDGKIKGCDIFHIPSPSVATYDLKPEMSCVEVTKRVILSTYVLSAVGAAIAGIVLTSYYNVAKSDLGSTFTMNIITIVVLGGTLSTGGKGNVFGTVLATIIIGLIKFGLPLCFGINSQYLDAPIGILLVVVLLGRALMVHPAFINYRAKLKNKRQKAA